MARRVIVRKGTVCSALGIPANKHGYWVKQNVVAVPAESGYTKRQAQELAVFAALLQHIPLKRLRPSWMRLRRQLVDRILAGEVYVIFYNAGPRRLVTAQSAKEVLDKILTGSPVQVVDLTVHLGAVDDVFTEAASGAKPSAEGVRVIRAMPTPNTRTRSKDA